MSWRASTRDRGTIWTTRTFEAALDDAQAEGRGDHRLGPGGPGDPRPDRRQLPRLLQLPADLPARARAAGGRALVRGGRGGMSPGAHRAAERRGREPRPRRLPPRRRRDRQDDACWSTASAPPRSTRRSGSSGSSPSPSPSGPRTSSAAGSGRSSPARLRERRGRAARGPARGARGDRAGLDLDDPRLLPPAARLPPRRRRASILASGWWTRPRPSGSRRAPSTRRSRSWSPPGEPEALELAAANRRRTLLEMTRGAYDELRSHGDPSPALPELAPPDTAAAIAELIEAARRGPRRVRGGERPGGGRAASGSPRAMALDPAAAARRRAPGAAAGPGDQVGREGLQGRGVRALHEAAEASPGRGRGPRPRPRLRAAPRAGRALRRALRASSRPSARRSTSRTSS